jgi:hypothetical protein
VRAVGRGDRLNAGAGDDVVHGEVAADRLFGGSGADTLLACDGVRGNHLVNGGRHACGARPWRRAAKLSVAPGDR